MEYSRIVLPVMISLLLGCQAPATTNQSGPDIRMSEVKAYRHIGEQLESTADAREASISPDGSKASLTEGVLSITDSQITLGSPPADIDLQNSNASGREGVEVEGPGYRIAGRSYELDAQEATLSIHGEVEATTLPNKHEETHQDQDESDHGSSTREDSAQPVHIDADQVVLHRRTNKAVFTGDVVVVRDDFRLTSDSLIVTYGENQEITHLLAEGNVKMTEPDRVITARRGEFDNVREVLTLIGDAVLIQNDNIINGDRVIYTLTSDEVRVKNVRARVRMGDAPNPGERDR